MVLELKELSVKRRNHRDGEGFIKQEMNWWENKMRRAHPVEAEKIPPKSPM